RTWSSNSTPPEADGRLHRNAKAPERSGAFCFGRGYGDLGPINRRVLLLLGVGLLAGCATTPAVEPSGPLAALEPRYSARAGREALTIEVSSNGCTHKADFTFYVERKGGAATVAFARRRLDTCQSFAPGKTALSFAWAELGLAARESVFLLNAMAPWHG